MGERKEVVIYTDGSCIENPGPGGYGIILCYNNREKEISGGYKLTTSSRMEIMAAIVGLKALKFPCFVTIYSDSTYLVNSMTEGWVYKWKANDWWRNRRERVANIDLWNKLIDLCEQHIVKFEWLKGHDGHYGNEKCDMLAKNAATRSNLPPDDGYTNPSISDYSRQLNLQQVFNRASLVSPSENIPEREPHIQNRESQLAKVEKGRESKHTKCIRDFELDGIRYIFKNGMWYDAKTFLKPDKKTIHRLNDLLAPIFEQEDGDIHNIDQLLSRAREARDIFQYKRATDLARSAIKMSPDCLPAAAILSSSLRASGHAQQAIDETEAYKMKSYPPLLTSRAAALCDVGRWEDAKKTIGRVLAMSKGDRDAVFGIVHRIKAERPDLYDE